MPPDTPRVCLIHLDLGWASTGEARREKKITGACSLQFLSRKLPQADVEMGFTLRFPEPANPKCPKRATPQKVEAGAQLLGATAMTRRGFHTSCLLLAVSFNPPPAFAGKARGKGENNLTAP